MAFYNYDGKKMFYEEVGEGIPVVFIHGNTASSKMFNYVLDLYKDEYKVILIDFLGHGDSERLTEFPTDLWYDEALQLISFLESKDYGKVNLVGTSGGALVAINVALERPELVNKLVADSFEGEKSLESYVMDIDNDREGAKKDEGAIQFWRSNHGDDWESVVDNDTEAVKKHHSTIGNFYHKDISKIKVPILLTGSREDEYCPHLDKIYESMSNRIVDCDIHIFEKGGHPALLSNGPEFVSIIKEYFK